MCFAALATSLSLFFGLAGANSTSVLPSPMVEVSVARPPDTDAGSYHVMFELGSAEMLDLVVPAGFAPSHVQGFLMEFARPPETVQNWTVLITMLPLEHYTGDLAALRKAMTDKFLQDCKKGNTLTTDFPMEVTGTNKIMEWAVGCDLLAAGPSAGQPETTLYRLMTGSEVDVLLMIGFRAMPTQQEIENWRQFLGKSSLKPNPF